MLEEQFTEQVLQAARIWRWRTAHFRPALTAKGWRTPVQGDGAGFPDLILVRGARCMVAELKVPKTKGVQALWAGEDTWQGRVKLWEESGLESKLFGPGQIDWLTAFEQAHIEVHVWTPADLEAVIGALK